MVAGTGGRVRAARWTVPIVCLVLVGAGTSCRKRQPRVSVPPAVAQPGEEVGIASWYGHPYHGRRTASGEVYDMDDFTAAHRTRPLGSWVRVYNLENGKWVDVRINDRGPFVDGRIIDLSRAAARAIDMIGAGTAWVRLQTIPAPGGAAEAAGAAAAGQARYGIQVGAFRRRKNAERLARKMKRRWRKVEVRYRDGDPPLWRVVVGSWPAEHQAREAIPRVKGAGGPAFVVRLDPEPRPKS